MKPQLIRADRLNISEQQQVADWLKLNSCPWLIPWDSTIHITGNHFTVRTWTIKNTRQSGTLWPKHIPYGWQPPTKLRKYRIRHELRLTQ